MKRIIFVACVLATFLTSASAFAGTDAVDPDPQDDLAQDGNDLVVAQQAAPAPVTYTIKGNYHANQPQTLYYPGVQAVSGWAGIGYCWVSTGNCPNWYKVQIQLRYKWCIPAECSLTLAPTAETNTYEFQVQINHSKVRSFIAAVDCWATDHQSFRMATQARMRVWIPWTFDYWGTWTSWRQSYPHDVYCT